MTRGRGGKKEIGSGHRREGAEDISRWRKRTNEVSQKGGEGKKTRRSKKKVHLKAKMWGGGISQGP